MSQSLTPISASERLPVIDALRGFAILGILVMNVKHSSHPITFSHLWPSKLEGVVETVTYWGLEFLMYGKFFTLFRCCSAWAWLCKCHGPLPKII